MDDSHRRFVTRLVEYAGSAAKAAEMLGVSAQAVSVWGIAEAKRPPGVLACLKIAQILREPVYEVLRSAGHDAEVAVLRDLFGSGDDERVALPHSERALLALWRKVSRSDRRLVLNLLEHLARTAVGRKDEAVEATAAGVT